MPLHGEVEIGARQRADNAEASRNVVGEHEPRVERVASRHDGVSLTITALAEDAFEVALVRHTLDATTLGSLDPGDGVNLEVDVLAKYVERLAAR